MSSKKFLMIPADKYERMEAQLQQLHSGTSGNNDQPSSHQSSDPPHPEAPQSERERSPEPPSPSPSDEPDSLAPHFILMNLPHRYRAKAQKLLDLIKDHVTWNDDGEIINAQGVSVRGSHMSTLIRDWLQPYTKIIPGRETFAKLVKDCDLPPTLKPAVKATLISGEKKRKMSKPPTPVADKKRKMLPATTNIKKSAVTKDVLEDKWLTF